MRLTETHTIDGMAYELYAQDTANKNAARIRVLDADAGEVVSNTFYPRMAQAQAAYNDAVETARIVSGAGGPSKRIPAGGRPRRKGNR